MKYYLVAILDDDSYLYVEKIQKNLSKKYRLYHDLPTLHITLDTISDPDIEKLSTIITDIIKPYKKFKVSVNGIICFDPPTKSVNLKIDEQGYIIRLVNKINSTLLDRGFIVREGTENWDLHISLANTNFADRDWSISEFTEACEHTKQDNIKTLLKIERLELWKPINNKKKMLVKSFPLKDY
jgi:2'-5' RNA ligase